MQFSDIFRRGISLRKQRAGRAEDGPLGPLLRELSRIHLGVPAGSALPLKGKFYPASPVGFDLGKIVSQLDIWVLFVNTGGSGIAPWQGLIVLDADYEGQGQVESPFKVGMASHELTHLLQRRIRQTHYWPGGGINPIRGRRWIGDSTNFMELLAYLVGWTVEYDLASTRLHDPELSPAKQVEVEAQLATIRDRLAVFTGVGSHAASRMICDLFPDNPIYRQNFETERRYADRRVPPGPWHAWLRQMGFTRTAVDHIMVLAAQGHLTKAELPV